MENVPILGHDDERRIFHQFEAQYDAPAFVRRARQVEAALEQLLDRCRAKRAELAELARIRLGQLKALAGGWEPLQRWLAGDEDLAQLRHLEADLEPRLRLPVEQTSSRRALRRALVELIESLERFNRRWLEFLPTLDLGPINQLREGYNRYYLLEKECALRSARMARQGFSRLSPLTTDDLVRLLPPLPVPQLKP